MPNYEEQKQTLKAAEISDELIDSYISSIKGFEEAMKELNKKNVHGIPRTMEGEDYELLWDRFTKALNSVETVTGKLRSSIKNESLLPDFLRDNERFFLRNYRTFKTITDKKESIPLALAVHREEKRVYYGASFDGSVFGGAQSHRNVIKVQGSDGKTRIGVFTPSVRYTEEQMKKGRNLSERYAKNMGIKAGERIDSRNSAMFDVAKMLGREDLIAHSEDITVEQKGKTVQGSFMEYVEDGTDVSRITRADNAPITHVDPDDYHTTRLKGDVLDLSIIDYICYNTDRHSGNMIYRYADGSDGKTRLNGIVGIDNDSSFGTKKINPNESDNQLQALDHTVVITEKMADKVMKMTDMDLRSTLGRYDFSSEAVNAAVERLHNVQARIGNGREFSERLKTEQLTGTQIEFLKDPIECVQKNGMKSMMIVVPDNHMKKLDIDSIGNHTKRYSEEEREWVECGVGSAVKKFHNRELLSRLMVANELKGVQALKLPKKSGVPLVQDIHGISRSITATLSAEHETLTTISSFNEEQAEKLAPITSAMKNMFTLTNRLQKNSVKPTENELNRFNELNSELQTKFEEYLSGADKKSAVTKEVEKMKAEADHFSTDMHNIQDKDLLELNFRASRQADILHRLMPEVADARLKLSELSGKETIDRQAVTDAAARVIYLEAVSTMDKIDPDTMELMLDKDIMAKNMNKLTRKTEEYLNDMDWEKADMRGLLGDAKALLSGFRLYTQLTKAPETAPEAAPKEKNVQPTAKEEKAKSAFRAMGLG